MQKNIDVTEIQGTEYVTVSQMASLTNRSDQTIYALIKRGNKIRKMKSIKIVDRVLIPLSEYREYPFTYAGRNCQDIPYHYNEDGTINEGETNGSSSTDWRIKSM